jgi:hypothetical protein
VIKIIDPGLLSLLPALLLDQGGVAKKMSKSDNGLIDKSKLVT